MMNLLLDLLRAIICGSEAADKAPEGFQVLCSQFIKTSILFSSGSKMSENGRQHPDRNRNRWQA